jgi:hypothetical protein
MIENVWIHTGEASSHRAEISGQPVIPAGRTYDVWMSNASSSIAAIQLPTGGTLVGFNNPNPPTSDCSAVINLQGQVAPLIASMSCQLKILKLMKPLIDVIKGLPNPSVQAIQAFAVAAEDLAPCLLEPTPAVVLPFLRDLLCLEIRSLNCFLHNLENALGGITAAKGVLDSYPPVVATLNLAGALFQIAGFTPPQAPVLGDGTDPASLKADQAAVTGFVASLQTMADALGGCS